MKVLVTFLSNFWGLGDMKFVLISYAALAACTSTQSDHPLRKKRLLACRQSKILGWEIDVFASRILENFNVCKSPSSAPVQIAHCGVV